jgi:hypothetical protein
MTVGELIEKLSAFDKDMRVFVDGYEGGLDDPKEPRSNWVVLDYHEHDYYGRHEYHHCTDMKPADCSAVIIPRD